MFLGIALAFGSVYFWGRHRGNNTFFLIVLAALFNYLHSFFRVLETIQLIPSDWFLSIGAFPAMKFIVIMLSMLFLLLGMIKLSNYPER